MCNQGKKIGFLCVLLVVSGGWIALASRQGGDVAGLKTENGGQKTEDTARSTDPIRHPSFLSDPNLPSSQGINLGNGELFLRMMLSVGLVIGLKLIGLTMRPSRADYEPDRGACFGCARCFSYCPSERVRVGLQPLAPAAPSAAPAPAVAPANAT